MKDTSEEGVSYFDMRFKLWEIDMISTGNCDSRGGAGAETDAHVPKGRKLPSRQPVGKVCQVCQSRVKSLRTLVELTVFSQASDIFPKD